MIVKSIIFVIIGGALGFGLQRMIGCPGGGCPLMRSPLTSIMYGAVIGLLMSFGK